MNKPVATQPTTPAPVAPVKKVKSNYMIPVLVCFAAVAAFLLVWYFAVK